MQIEQKDIPFYCLYEIRSIGFVLGKCHLANGANFVPHQFFVLESNTLHCLVNEEVLIVGDDKKFPENLVEVSGKRDGHCEIYI